ncbi:MAG: MBL fold metallo-hydrolase [Chitinophagales bacterium]|nr:MBL fold metallo-hydrolase [Chitinophagales bacterium]
MNKSILLFVASSLLLSIFSCKSFQPSANLNNYQKYFESADTVFDKGKVRITFFGTSTLLFDDGETQLLIDGFFSRPNAAKAIFGKVKTDTLLLKSILAEQNINRLGGIFVCHSHYDHAMDAPYVAHITGATVYGSSSTSFVCSGAGLPQKQTHVFAAGEKFELGKFTIEVLTSKHTPPFKILGKSNATDPNHPNITQPLRQPAKADKFIEGGTFDFYITHGKKRFCVKASTNYLDSALYRRPTDVFFLGTAMLGKFTSEFREKYFAETITATGAKTVVPIHWDNFTRPLSRPLEALPRIGDNVDAGFTFLIEKCEQQKIKLQMLQGKQSLVY